MRSSILCALLACCAAVCLHAQQYGTDYVSQVENKPALDPRQFQFTYVSGGFVTGDLSTPGSNTLTLAVGPLGVSGTDANHYLYVSGGTGTAEAVLITGGTCTPGATACTLIITTANAHTGAWTLGSATSGIAEVVAFAVANGNQAAALPAGSFTMHAPVYWPLTNGLYLLGQGTQATLLNVAADFPMSAPCVLNVVQNASYVSTSGVEHLSMKFIQPDSAGPYTQWPPAILFSSNHIVLRDLEIIAPWNAIVADTALSQGAGSAFIDHVTTSAFHHGIELDEIYDSTYISRYRSWPVGLTTAQLNQFLNPAQANPALYIGRVDDLQVTDFNSESPCAVFYLSGTGGGGAPGGGTSGHINGMWCDQGGFTMSAGGLRISNAHFGAGVDVTLLAWFGGQLLVENSTFVNSGTGLTQDLIEANAQTTASSFGPSTIQITNSYFNSFANNIHSVFCNDGQPTTANSFCTITNSFFYRSPNVAYTAPTISVIDGATGFARLTAMDNTASDVGSGSGNFIAVGSDDYHQIGPNSINGYTYLIPANAVKTAVSPPLKVAFSALGTVPAAGYQRYCTNCTTAATCAGSGSGHMATSNGTNWTCQ